MIGVRGIFREVVVEGKRGVVGRLAWGVGLGEELWGKGVLGRCEGESGTSHAEAVASLVLLPLYLSLNVFLSTSFGLTARKCGKRR